MHRVLLVFALTLGTTACGSNVHSIRKPPGSAMSILFVTIAATFVVPRRRVVWEPNSPST